MIKSLNIHNLNLIQVRAATSEATVAEYAGAISAGAKFPPISVITDGTNYWVWDGVHRYLATKQAEEAKRRELESSKDPEDKKLSALHQSLDMIACEVTNGTHEDAVRAALGANATHGLRRTQADIATAIKLALKSWPILPSREIARICGVSPATVLAHRTDKPEKVLGADGRLVKSTHDKPQASSETTVQVEQSSPADGMPPTVAPGEGEMVAVTTPPVSLDPDQADPLKDLDSLDEDAEEQAAAQEASDSENDEVDMVADELGITEGLLTDIDSQGANFLSKVRQDRTALLKAARERADVTDTNAPVPAETRAELARIQAYWTAFREWTLKHG